MVANSDIQLWQNAVKGINETGKTDLTKEEWSALAVLNGCLSSGNFSTEESRCSYQTLKDSMKKHGNNPVLYRHLYDFLTLCHKYATAIQSSETPETPAMPITSENHATPIENKQSIKLKNILFGANGQFKQTLSKNLKFAAICLLIATALAGIIYALNAYANMPAYVATLVVGTLASITLLRKNQNGQIREKLAFVGAAAAGIFMYFRYGGQISGGSTFVWTFLVIGLILSFVGKSKPNFWVWLAEVIPAAFCFLVFERLGGAISGFGAKDMIFGNLASVRYMEAFKIFLLFCLFQSFANNAVAAQYRECVCSKFKDLLFYGVQTAVVLLLLCVCLNPFKLSILDNVKSELIAFSQPVRAGADVFDTAGNKLGNAKKMPISSALLCKHIPGYLATAYDFNYDGGFDTARITFEYDVGLGRISDRFQPRIYYFNESDGTLEELPDQKMIANYSGGWASVTAKTTHFSTYILLNSVEYNKVWETVEIRKPAESDLCSCGSSTTAMQSNTSNFDVVFVIDESGSMNDNDPNRLRVEAAKQFIDMLAADSKDNRAAIYGFEGGARSILNLTTLNDREAVKNSLNSIHSNGGTNIYSGLEAAVREIEANTHAYSPVIILMTDGQDNSTLTNYTPLIERANAKGITVFAIGLGKDVNATLLRQICDNTGGGVYYYAENSDVLPFIFKSANTAIVDFPKDGNGDGISDYYAKLLNEGILRLSNGSGQFKGIDWVNCPADLDGDGLLNGEELVVTTKIVNGVEQVCVVMKSDPTKKDSKPNNNQSASNYFTYSGGDIANDDPKNGIYKVSDYKTDYTFSTDYFSKPANEYNHDLSIMSLQLAMAAFGLHNEPYGSTKANNIRCLLTCMGFENIETRGYEKDPYDIDPTGNSIAATIARMSLENNGELLVIAVRGGEYKAEWGGNFNVGGGDVHEGFNIAKEKILGYYTEYLSKYGKNFNGKNLKLWITGYSRGSAVANLLGARFNDLITQNKIGLIDGSFSLKHEDVYTYCFATPNVSKNAKKEGYENIFYIISPFDPVPRIPFSGKDWGFKKYGREIRLPNPKSTAYNVLENNMLDELDKLNSSFNRAAYLIGLFKVHKGNTGYYNKWAWKPQEHTAIYDLGIHDEGRGSETMDIYLDHLIGTTLYEIIGSQEKYEKNIQSSIIKIIVENNKLAVKDLIGKIWLKLLFNIVLNDYNNDDIATLGPSDEHLDKLLNGNNGEGDDNIGNLLDEYTYPAVYKFEESHYDKIAKAKNITRKQAVKQAAQEAKNNFYALQSGHYPELYLAWLKSLRDSQYLDDELKITEKK